MSGSSIAPMDPLGEPIIKGAGAALNAADLLENRIKFMEDPTSCYTLTDVQRLLAKLKNITQRVYFLRNSLVPIHSLPDEILSSTFRLLVTNPADTIKLGNVCRRWRATTLSDALLWTDIAITGGESAVLEPTNTYLRRSKNAPLTIRINLPRDVPDVSPDWIQLLQDHASRISEFRFVIHWNGRPALLEKLSLPNVEEMSLAGCSAQWEPIPAIFPGGLPRLQHLELNDFDLWPQGLCTNLTSLQLKRDWSGFVSEISRSNLLDILDDNPRLRSLRIEGYGLTRNEPGNRISTLPHLTTLKIERADASQILSHLRVPSTTAISVARRLGRHTQGIFEQTFTSTFPADFRRLGSQTQFQPLEVTVAYRNVATSHKVSCRLTDTDYSEGAVIITEDLIAANGSSEHMDRALRSFLISFRNHSSLFSRTTRLSISLDCSMRWMSDPSTITKADWTEALLPFPFLDQLSLSNRGGRFLETPLLALGDPILPHLRSVELELKSSQSEAVEWLQRLFVCAERRQAAFPVHEVTFRFYEIRGQVVLDAESWVERFLNIGVEASIHVHV